MSVVLQLVVLVVIPSGGLEDVVHFRVSIFIMITTESAGAFLHVPMLRPVFSSSFLAPEWTTVSRGARLQKETLFFVGRC